MAAAAAGLKQALLVVLLLSVVGRGRRVEARVNHVVGDDRGWDNATDLSSWFTGRIFRVGDIIWFVYSAAEESLVELETAEEFLNCDLRKPVRMYSDGLVKIPLEEQGIRYFASGNPHSCKKGLKLPVKVHPPHSSSQGELRQWPVPVAAPPPAIPSPPRPSTSTHLAATAFSFVFFVGFLPFCYLGLF